MDSGALHCLRASEIYSGPTMLEQESQWDSCRTKLALSSPTSTGFTTCALSQAEHLPSELQCERGLKSNIEYNWQGLPDLPTPCLNFVRNVETSAVDGRREDTTEGLRLNLLPMLLVTFMCYLYEERLIGMKAAPLLLGHPLLYLVLSQSTSKPAAGESSPRHAPGLSHSWFVHPVLIIHAEQHRTKIQTR